MSSDDALTLELAIRDVTGKQVKRLRQAGSVPAVIHDHGKPSLNVQAPYLDIYRTYVRAGKHHPVQLVAGSKKFTALIKAATFEPKKNQLTHVVFNAVDKNQKVEAEIPVRAAFAEGNEASPAERAGLIVLEQLAAVQVEALPKDLPDELTYDAEKLVEVGDQVTVAELQVPTGVVVLTEPTHVLATVFEPSALAAANEAAAGEATAEEAQTVPAEHESTAEEGTQADELRPGGKEQKESKSQGHDPVQK